MRIALSEREQASAVKIAAAPPPPPGKAGSAEGAAGDPSASTAPAETQTATSTPSPAGQAAPARSVKGADTYALRVFRHIRAAKQFPAHLARTGVQGRVLVRFDITSAGDATGVGIARSSGVAVLDALALEQIRAAVPYPRPPRQLEAVHLHFIVPMTYRPAS
ncbi:hypothetical protein A8V01_06075 [Novosphingobium guangzhouense]|uniref:TonB C-terminal domain-containing protein n=1 Tax=Novosphingobium guangzhouense TaxID=1850347 RepID=A0A2K2FX08_9SPHN|nr:hypothetical protein A8V01_06075 [Novosphingobium guangzhouense]